MSLTKSNFSLLGILSILFAASINAADVVVQLNVNRPLNDVNERFVSFAIKPEELYRALDGDNRRFITRMASMLGDSYIKFSNDYEFAMNSDMKLRNPTKIIWKGFNRWARAVNWTMVIPIPYDPESWDPMETLRILNSSYLNGITDCVWQLGTDFGSSHADDYVAELKTLNLMVDSFKPYVDDWSIMGADISAGSSVEETKRYIDTSKGLNAAFGWTHSTQIVPSNNLGTFTHENDPALRLLLQEKVPVWLTLPPKNKAKNDDTNEALQWAKVLGDSASSGFDVVFKHITANDLERPNFSYYVSALFKKVMGSRVFPARPLNMFTKADKLYTHCANTVSGGIAFMIVNSNENALQVQVHSLSKVLETEVWKYTLTMKKSSVLLNDQRIWYNSTLKPQKSIKQANKAILLTTPGRSVSFWVLPTVNLEHCQYTEVAADELTTDSTETKQIEKRFSSSDKLLRTLIQESSLANNPLVRAMSRRRRYTTESRRPKRFILKDKTIKSQNWGKLFAPFAGIGFEKPEEERVVKKRENPVKPKRPISPFEWFTEFMENTMTGDLPLLKRGVRSIDDTYFGPLFATKDGKTTAFTRKITEIKKPEKNIKPIFDMEEFDEEEFFKKIGTESEPEYQRLPEGDVVLKHITNPDGEELEEEREVHESKTVKNKQKFPKESRELVNEMKPLKFLPTELYEGLNPFKPATTNFGNFGGALNTFLFPEPFAKKPTKMKKVSGEKENKSTKKSVSSQLSQLAKDFLRTQKELSKTFSEDNKNSESTNSKKEEEKDISDKTTKKADVETTTTNSSSLEATDSKKTKKQTGHDFLDYIPDNIENFFGENDGGVDMKSSSDELPSKPKFDEISWWDLGALNPKRTRRALHFSLPDGDIHENMISKDEDLIPLGAKVEPMQLAAFEYRVNDTTKSNKMRKDVKKDENETGIVATFKEKVSSIVDIFSRHVSEWYNTLTRHFENSVGVGNNKEESYSQNNVK